MGPTAPHAAQGPAGGAHLRALDHLRVERLKALKRQVPLVYAILVVNLAGFQLATPDPPAWTIIWAAGATCLIVHRLVYWHRLRVEDLTSSQIEDVLRRHFWVTRAFSILFFGWSMSLLVAESSVQPHYVILFSVLAAIGCSVALMSAPDAARQPLALIAIPLAAWALLAGEMALLAVGFSLLLIAFIIQRILVLQDRNFRRLVNSKATISYEREKLRASEERYELVSRATNDLIWDWDLATDRLVWNDALALQMGYAAHEIEPTIDWWTRHIHPDHAERVAAHVRALIEDGGDKFEDEYPFRRADGSYAQMYDRGFIIRDEDGTAIRMVGAMQDLTERKRAQDDLVRAATRDPLTDLPNRKLFLRELATTVDEAVGQQRWSSLLVLDLDGFKQVNDSLGHDAGDALLKELASRMRDCLPADSVLARLGGDEFAVILRGKPSAGDVQTYAEAVLARLREPFMRDGRVLDCSATIGAALIPHHGNTPEEVLKSADMALYAAKAERRGRFLLFEPAHRAEMQRRVAMRRLAKSALADSRIVPFYQSIVSLADGQGAGFEALLRCRQPGRGIQLPGTIAAAFDDLELAEALSDCMIEQVLADVRSWLDRGLAFGYVALNAAAAEFRRDDFGDRLLEQLNEREIPASCIRVEVTESTFIGRGAECVDRALKTLSSAGVKIALDDFGTGYASLRHLKQFPVDIIKIDRSFVRDMEADAEDDAIVRAVINLSTSLGMEVVSEGIERTSQAEHLSALGCRFGQGFLFSKAVPASRVPSLVGQSVSGAFSRKNNSFSAGPRALRASG